MELDDFRAYFALRKQVANPWSTVRFRRRSRHKGHELVVQLNDGLPLYLRGGTQDFKLFREIYVSDAYRLAGCGGWDTIVDLGGNVGMFAVFANRIARRIVVYEPFAEHVRQMRRNCAGRAGIEIVEAAVAGQPGRLRLYRPSSFRQTAVHSTFPEFGGRMSAEFDEVQAVTLDAIFDQHEIARCDLLKIDIEGREYDVLHATSDATFARIERIYGEYHDVQPEDPRTRIAHLSGFLGGKGFSVTLAPDAHSGNDGMFFAVRS